ncbi:MAG: YkgJ family cysteine cluster protein [Deltaproteobacteria bacterium]|nr:YkgJ family cysteine cluster protein [Deltaproteobacteria bacterium]
MKKAKFTGKIRTDPWESLARGSREVMASLWGEYLAEMLKVSKKSARFRILRQQIEEAAGYKEIFRKWNPLSPEDRGEAWRRLVETARAQAKETEATCVRCGECCESSSPVLLLQDLPLFMQEVLTPNEVYALPKGASSPEGLRQPLEEERLKIREVPGSRQCWFYQAAQQKCRIYDQRPEQCRRRQCWGEPPPEPDSEEYLNRSHIFRQIPEIWDLITAHQERCDRVQVREALERLAQGEEEAGDILFEALHFDHHLRQMLLSEWEMGAAATEMLLGRSLTDFLRDLGFKATLTREGVFRVEPRQCRA